jgi:hypothetical protein
MSVEDISTQVSKASRHIAEAPFAASLENLEKADISGILDHLRAALDGLNAALVATSTARHSTSTAWAAVNENAPQLGLVAKESHNPSLQGAADHAQGLVHDSLQGMRESAALCRSGKRAQWGIADVLEQLEKTFEPTRNSALTAASLCIGQQQEIANATEAYITEISGGLGSS